MARPTWHGNYQSSYRDLPSCATIPTAAIRSKRTPPQSLNSFRQAIQRSSTNFGIAGGSIYLDILWIVDDGKVSRTAKEDSTMIVTALTSALMPKISLQKESSFLPALCSSSTALDEEGK
ncbi:hypothetical protein ARMGADRAFT_1075796 [Armillaria gallica]|uniref:Uncharacterized protein n=1 Tax=Armillaria gallica TaxID=47427 RepID=A0A2H3DTU8_ARMGA|nr:hypothetical protein ARMGADRAFT_1075796 [Armillaria gallica]